MQGTTRLMTERKAAACQKACPAGIDVPRYVRAIAAGRFDESLAVIRESIPFPSVCGYACFAPCEVRCGKGQFDAPVAIRALKRAAAERGGGLWKNGLKKAPPTGKKVAVIGAGPSGLTAAYFLALKGHRVVVFEGKGEAGGMMRWAIPGYRLSRETLRAEVDEIEALGVEIKTDTRADAVAELIGAGYHAVYIACGAQKNVPLGIPGDDLAGVFGAIDFLESVNRGNPLPVRGKVAVIGGGNAAIDAARSAIRLGAAEVKLFYRRTRNEMPAYPDEVDAAIDEGVKIEFLASPAMIKRQGDGLQVLFDRMELGPPDRDGRPRPIPKSGCGFGVVVDTVISAIGQAVSLEGSFGVPLDGKGLIPVTGGDLSTAVPGVFAGGDAVRGPSSIIEAISDGKRAASAIDRSLGGDGSLVLSLATEGAGTEPGFCRDDFAPRIEIPCLSTGIRVNNFDVVESTLNPCSASREAGRCLSCDYRQFDVELDFEGCKECGYCLSVCHMDVFSPGTRYNEKGYRAFEVKQPANCVGCMKCFYSCPDFCLEIKGA
jgi:NADPH-dependent glutamate synthase beta subunit-like oxidoreductase/NAD-dependent dihydropyrimidine dehydrogenase PreA subunit